RRRHPPTLVQSYHDRVLSCSCSCSLADAAPRQALCLYLQHTPPTVIYTLSLHDALPICIGRNGFRPSERRPGRFEDLGRTGIVRSEEHSLNSSHQIISYAVFCLKKKTKSQADGRAFYEQ